MTSLSWLVLFSLFLTLGCEVKEKLPEEVIANHGPAENKFTFEAPNSSTYTPGNVLYFKLSFPYIMQVTGVPRLKLTVGSVTRYANYVAGDDTKSLMFQYSVLATDEDSDGINLEGLELNSGTITFASSSGTTNCDITTVTAKNLTGLIINDGLIQIEKSCGSLDQSLCQSFVTGGKLPSISSSTGALYVAFRAPSSLVPTSLLGGFLTLVPEREIFLVQTPEAIHEIAPKEVAVIKINAENFSSLSGLILDSEIYEVTLTSSSLTPSEEQEVLEKMSLIFK